jgi:hypothetical protein
LLSYGPELKDIFRRGAPYVDQVLRGVKPADLPVQVPIKFEMAVNARTAKALGLTVPLTMQLTADEVIDFAAVHESAIVLWLFATNSAFTQMPAVRGRPEMADKRPNRRE